MTLARISIMPFMFFLIFLPACSQKKKEAPINNNPGHIYFTYGARYSAGFDEGRKEYLKMVLEVWKEYETGDITKTANYFADSIVMVFPDHVWRGKRDSILGLCKKKREIYSSVQSHIDYWMPVKMKDRSDEAVFIWGWQENTRKTGQLDAPVLHEIWKFNKDGKIYLVQQYLSAWY